MKFLVLFFFSLFSFNQVKAQLDVEVKVTSTRYAPVVGQLKKVSSEGIAVEDYFGNYLIYKPNEIKKVKIRKRGITILEGLGGGSLGGLAIGGALAALDKEGRADNEMLKITALLTGVGAVGGTLVGVISQIVNTKYTLIVNEEEDNFKKGYKNLEKYVNTSVREHVN